MSRLEIKIYPDPILRRKSKEVEEITQEIRKLAKDMIETMQNSDPEGIGLAAPQVGKSLRIIVVQTEGGPAVFINPKIIKKSKEKEVAEEGCLSLPGVWLKIKRAKWVEMEAVALGPSPLAEGGKIDINGEISKIKAEGLLARVLQHEIDHLNGVLITDRVGFFQKFFKK